jgi:hypothetical protein
MTWLPEVNTLKFLQFNSPPPPQCVPPSAHLRKASHTISAPTSVDGQQWPPYSTKISPLVCCNLSLAVVLSFRRRDHNRTDSYRVSMADVPDMLQRKRDYSCCRVVTAGHQQKWTRWLCTMPSTNLAEGGTHGGRGQLYWRNVFTSGNRVISRGVATTFCPTLPCIWKLQVEWMSAAYSANAFHICLCIPYCVQPNTLCAVPLQYSDNC